MLTDWQKERFNRQIVIPLVGEAGQEKLLAARVLVVGLGGLGSPVAYYLAAAGVGLLGLMDGDVVSESNLQRQIIHGSSTLGVNKVDSAGSRLQDLNPHLDIVRIPARLTDDNAPGIAKEYDMVIGCLDNIESRYVLNKACVATKTPFIEAGVIRFSGIITTVIPGKTPCFKCIFPQGPGPGAMTPAQAGIFGATAGVAGSIQAMEAIKLILGIGEVLNGRLLLMDLLSGSFREVSVNRNPECEVCGNI